MNQSDQKISDKNLADSAKSSLKVSLLKHLKKKMNKSIDADYYYKVHIEPHLNEYYDEKKQGLFKRLNSYLFQYSHYVNNIKKDILSHSNSLSLYIFVYLFGLILIPTWMTFLEVDRIINGGNVWVSLCFIAAYIGIIVYGGSRTIKTLKQKHNLKASINSLYLHGLTVLKESEIYNIRLLSDANYGTLHGFDDHLNKALDLSSLLANEYNVVKKSYTHHLLNNSYFNYMNLPSVIRAHQALYVTTIKHDVKCLGDVEGEELMNKYEASIKKIHSIHLKRFNNLIQPSTAKNKIKPA